MSGAWTASWQAWIWRWAGHSAEFSRRQKNSDDARALAWSASPRQPAAQRGTRLPALLTPAWSRTRSSRESPPARSARALQGSPLVVAPSAMLLTLAPRVTPVRAPTGVGRLRPARAGLVSARAYPRDAARAPSSRAPATRSTPPRRVRPRPPARLPRARRLCRREARRARPRVQPRGRTRSGAEPIGLSSSWRRRSRSSAPPPRASPPARSASSSPRSTRSSAR